MEQKLSSITIYDQLENEIRYKIGIMMRLRTSGANKLKEYNSMLAIVKQLIQKMAKSTKFVQSNVTL
jgi:hypothetical protein